MTNPHVAMRMLITYVICIPLAILLGYLLTNPLDYGTLGFLGLLLVILISPVFIKWHYPIMVFGLWAPVSCFFLIGRPPLWWVVVLMSLTIAILERIMNSDRRFLRVPVLTWPLLFIAAMAFLTAELTGGVGLHTLGGGLGGGRKYLTLFVGIACFFALVSHPIPPARRKFYVALFLLPGLLSLIGDLFPYLPAPLNYINLLIPPTGYNVGRAELGSTSVFIDRFSAVATGSSMLLSFMMARWGMRGIFLGRSWWRPPVFVLAFLLIPMGGFRAFLVGMVITIVLMMFLEGLRGPLLALLISGLVAIALLVPFAGHLPLNYQRTLSFLPLNWNQDAVLNAEASSEWRFNIWRQTWPKVPEYLLLGKGYGISQGDYDLIANARMINAAASFDASEDALALSGDYHNGPLSTLMPFGIWGAIGIVWLMAACLWVHYRNFRYGPADLKTVNAFLLAWCVYHSFAFFVIFGSFSDDIGYYAKYVGICVALNGGVLGPKPKQQFNPLIKPARPLPAGVPMPLAGRQIPI